MEIGTPVTGLLFHFRVGVQLFVLAICFFAGLSFILKPVAVCFCGVPPFDITMFKVALNVGEAELTFLKSHARSGFPYFPF
jgi:hypothetical protein